MKSFGCMPAVRTPEASRTLTVSCPGILPSPLRDKVGAFHHDRFRGYVSVHFRSGLHPPCLRFAVAVAGHHARLGTRLLVRLCRGRHFRQLNFMRLQGATLIEPVGRISRNRLSDRTSRLRPRLVAPKRGQTNEPEVPVEAREWIGPALAPPNLVLAAQPPAQPHRCVIVERPVCLVDGSYLEVVRPSAQHPVPVLR